MIIVHVINSLTIGGLEKIVVNICNNINLVHNEVYIITLSNKDFALKKEVNNNIKIISLPYKNDSFLSILKFWLFGLPKLVKILNDLKPEVIHSHLYFHYFLFLSIGIKISNATPSHCRTIHTSGLFYSSQSPLNLFRLSVEKLSSKIYPVSLISISKIIHEKNKRFFNTAKKIRLIPNGINLDKFFKPSIKNISKNNFNINEKTIIVAYVSRLNPGKNHSCLLKAWSEVMKKKSNVNLCIVGDGILKNALKRECEDLQILADVTFMGNIENIAEFLSIVDIGVFPSQFEGFPISLIEKMAMEVPIVTSDIDVFRDLIVDNENGIICQVDNFLDYAEKLINLIENEELRLRIGKNGRKTAEKYDIKRITSETISFYEETLSI